MYNEKTTGRVKDKQKYDRDYAKLQKQHDNVCSEYQKIVVDVSQMFDWQDGVHQDQKQKYVEM